MKARGAERFSDIFFETLSVRVEYIFENNCGPLDVESLSGFLSEFTYNTSWSETANERTTRNKLNVHLQL